MERWFETVRAQFLVEVAPTASPPPATGGGRARQLERPFHTWVEHRLPPARPFGDRDDPAGAVGARPARHVSGEELDAAFLWEATRSVPPPPPRSGSTATSMRWTRRSPRRVTLTYSPFDLAGEAVPIKVSYRGTSCGPPSRMSSAGTPTPR